MNNSCCLFLKNAPVDSIPIMKSSLSKDRSDIRLSNSLRPKISEYIQNGLQANSFASSKIQT